ncbi:MAG TPA: PaaI family thioesterase [Vitreimonas sp.]|jgi:uncharacterized protein (TIGR00369 family)|nr:PaaI family thioesterase [Vitreimonas sp.]
MPPVLHVTQANAQVAHDELFAPWVKQLGLCDFEVRDGFVAATLPAEPELQFAGAIVCGQAIMSAIDTVVSMAMMTTERPTKGTVYQHTHFLRPAAAESFRVEVRVLRFGKATAFAEARVTNPAGDLVAHASAEFAF